MSLRDEASPGGNTAASSSSGARARTSVLAGLAEHVVREGQVLSSTLRPVGERESLPAFLRRSLPQFPGSPIYRSRRGAHFVDVSWSEFLGRVACFGEFLRSRGVGRGDKVLVLSRNRGEMLIVEFATMSIGAIHLPIFAGYSAEQVQGLLEDSEAVAAVVSDSQQLAKLGETRPLRALVHFDAVDEALARSARERHGSAAFTSLAGAVETGAAASGVDAGAGATTFLDRCAAGLDPGAPCLMMYTSGTAGRQKGVLLTHDNILSQRRALARIWNIAPQDRFLSYLPWHHSFGGIFEKFTAIYNGASIAVDDSHGKDFALLLRNWKAVRPTVYFSVPVIYQRLVDHVRQHPEDEAEIFHPELKFVFTAAAPLPAGISAYFATRGIPVLEGWGLTETSPCCTVTDPFEPRATAGLVGYPIPDVRVKLAEDGEILVQGPNVMIGYHDRKEATRAVLPGDGWFHTGDVGEIVGSALRLVTRKDRIFKLLNGELVVPTPLENWLAGRSRYIQHALIAGASRASLSVLIFPNLPLIAMEFGADRRAADHAVKESFREAVRELNEKNPVRYERIQAFAVVSRELSVESHELTPSLKVRFSNVLQNHEGYIEAIYEPSRDCDCRFLRKIVRMGPDERRCFRGKDMTLDRCHECGLMLGAEAETHR